MKLASRVNLSPSFALAQLVMSRRCWIIVCLIACGALAGNLSADDRVDAPSEDSADERLLQRLPAESLTLEQLEAAALRNHPGLLEAEARIDAAIGRSWQAGLAPNPQLGYTSSEIGNGGAAGQHGAFIAQQFIRGGKLQLDRAVACRDVQRLREQYQAMRQRVLTDVRSKYYDVYWLQRQQALLERFRATNQQAAKIAEQLFRVGNNAMSDVLLAEIELEQTVSDLLAMDTQLEARWRELARLVGDPQLEPSQLREAGIVATPQLSWEEAISQIQQSPRLAAAAAELSAAELALRRARAEPIPNVNAQLSVQYDYGVDDTFASVQVGFPIPRRNRNQGGIYEARANVQVAEQRLARMQLQLEKNLATWFGDYRNAQLQADRLRTKIVPKAEEVVDIAFQAYEAGEISMSDVLNAQRSLLRASLRQQAAEKQLQSAFIQIEGFLLSESLEMDFSS